ncbi:superoxide dismutase [Candidatus Peregrinibacteria bacterium]|nr:superoxide dismutase [Candidatus Peregrinibacteria bacterium]
MKYSLPKLPYAYDALEPYVDAKTMEIHYSKHHQAYIDKLNDALGKHPEIAEIPLENLLQTPDKIPQDIKTTVINHGGGHYNHSLFWEIMAPTGTKTPIGKLAEKINEDLGGFEKFKETFSNAALTKFGSGWAWLSKDKNGKLVVTSTSNQDCPLSESLTPILCLDVWEHAYYLNYQNRRAEYIATWWNVVNWEKVGNLLK